MTIDVGAVLHAPVALVFDMGSGSGQARPPPVGARKSDRPWRKPRAAVAAERRAADVALACSSSDGGVHLGGLEVALRAQEFLDTRLLQTRVDPEAALPGPTYAALQEATTALLQAATNSRGAAEVDAAVAAVQDAAREAGVPLIRDRAKAGPATKLQLMHLVAPRLWLGGWVALNDGCSALRQRKVTHVVSVVSAEQRRLPPFVQGHHYHRVDDRELAAEEMACGFIGIVRFIDQARQAGGTVYVHCGAGISRAPTAAAAFLIWRLRLSAAGAISLLRRARPCVRPNVGFVRLLRAWEGACLALPPGALPEGFRYAEPELELETSRGAGSLMREPSLTGPLGEEAAPAVEAGSLAAGYELTHETSSLSLTGGEGLALPAVG